jgi:fructosamine-3-kinase
MKMFESLNEAIRQGYELYDRLPAGYLVRTALYDRWAFALVVPPVEAYGFHSLAPLELHALYRAHVRDAFKA